jgi:hypothetical protein
MQSVAINQWLTLIPVRSTHPLSEIYCLSLSISQLVSSKFIQQKIFCAIIITSMFLICPVHSIYHDLILLIKYDSITSTVKLKVAGSSEMLVTTYQTKLCYNAEIYDLNNNFSRNLEF